jgi:RNA polymerase sigma factor (sigma-70 family)
VAVTIEAVRQRTAIPHSLEFEAVFNEYWPRVYAVLFRLTGDPDEAQDLALEVFCRLQRQPPAAQATATLGGWLYQVATHLGYNALRAGKRRRYYEQQAGALVWEQEAALNPADEAERRIERQQVRRALARLKPRSAQLLILRYSGLSYAEIAAALGVAASSVGTLLGRAEDEFEQAYRAMTEKK